MRNPVHAPPETPRFTHSPALRKSLLSYKRCAPSLGRNRFTLVISQRGFAAIEFLIVAIPLLMASTASYEVSRWYMTREAVSLALLQAGRAGSVSHARPFVIEAAFLDALTPLYAPAGAFPSPRSRMEETIKRFEQLNRLPAWQITIVHPNAAEYADFMQKDLPIALKTGNPAINNNYQHEQHQHMPKGKVSGSTIYDANTLQLQLRYQYQPVVPGMRTLLRKAAAAVGDTDSPMSTLGIVPVTAAITIEMQSHPVLWISEQTTHVRYANNSALPLSGRPASPQPQAASSRTNADTAAVFTPAEKSPGYDLHLARKRATIQPNRSVKGGGPAQPAHARIPESAAPLGTSTAASDTTDALQVVIDDPEAALPMSPACQS